MNKLHIRTNLKNSLNIIPSISQTNIEKLKFELGYLIERNIKERKNLQNLKLQKGRVENHILRSLQSEVSGPVICSLNNLQPQLTKLKTFEERLDQAIESWVVLKGLLVDYSALWQVIAEDRPTWDTDSQVEKSPDLLKELIELQSKLEDQLLLQTRMTQLRIDQFEKVTPHLQAPWPKIAETDAINEITQLVVFQIGCLKHSVKFFESENAKNEKLTLCAAKKLRQSEKLDKFGKTVPCICWKKTRPLTSSNLHIWLYSPLEYLKPHSPKSIKFEDQELEVAHQSILQVWKYLGGSEWKLVGQMVKLVQHLKDLEQRQMELQICLDELQQVDHQLKKVRNERNLLQHELTRNRKFLTQIMLEKMVHQNTRLKHVLVHSSYPQSADPVVQELVQKNIELGNQVQELQEVVRYSREDAAKHQDQSRSIINSLNNAINSLEEVAVEFVLHEQTDQNLMFKLKAVVENDRMHNLMSKLNQDDLQTLQESLQKGNVGEVLIRLTEDLSRQQTNFCSLLHQLGPDGLASVLQTMSTTQLSALSEAVAAERLEMAMELLQSPRPGSELVVDAVDESQVTEVVGQVQQLLARMELLVPDTTHKTGNDWLDQNWPK